MKHFDYRFLVALLVGLLPIILIDPDLPVPAPFPFADKLILSLIAAMAYAGTFLALPAPKSMMERIAERVVHGNDRQRVDTAEAVVAATVVLDRIRELATNVDRPIADKVLDVGKRAEVIVNDLVDDPTDLSRTRRLLDHYLPEFVDVTERYISLSGKNGGVRRGTDDISEKYEAVVDDMLALCDRQTERNLADDTLKLDIDMDVLRKVASMDDR